MHQTLPTCLSLLLLLTGCGALQAPDRPLAPPDPPPPSLAAPCEAGPDYPDGDVRLADLMEVKRQREIAAADCRSRHRALAEAWPR